MNISDLCEQIRSQASSIRKIQIKDAKLIELFTSLGLDLNNFYKIPKAITEKYVYMEFDNFLYISIPELDYNFCKSILQHLHIDDLRNKCINLLKEQNYNSLYTLMPSRLRWLDFKKRYKNINKIYVPEIFKYIYSSTDFISSIVKDIPSRMLNILVNTNHKYKLKSNKKEITIYRGVGNYSTDINKALSWTLNINKALFFAQNQEHGKILEAKINPDKVIMYIDDRNEDEVLCLYDDISDTIKKHKIIQAHDDTIINYVNQTRDDITEANYFLKEFINKIPIIKTNFHDSEHSLRVYMNALLIIHLESNLNKEFKLSKSQLTILKYACLLHDIGRVTDSNCEHGKASMNMVIKNRSLIPYNFSDKEFDILTYLIYLHDKADSLFNIKKFLYNKENKILLDILKDADALDRVRLGNYRSEFDYNYLRIEASKRLPLVTGGIYKVFHYLISN